MRAKRSPSFKNDRGTVGSLFPNCTHDARAIERLSETRSQPSQLSQRVEQLDLAGSWFVVHEFAFPFGVGKELGRIQAVDRHQAERKAVEEFQRKGSELHISHAGGRPRRDSLGRPRHAGNSPRRRA